MESNGEPIAVNVKAERAHLRSLVYGLLARLLRRPPDRDLVAHLRVPEVFASLVEAGMELSRRELLGGTEDTVLDVLALEYSTLFDSPSDRVHLNESVYRTGDGFLMGKSTVQVRQLIDSLGLSIDERRPELPDHFAIELEIMQKLTEAEAVMWDSHQFASADACRVRQRAFLEEHLGRWAGSVCDAIVRRARTTLYREVARLTVAFLRQEARTLARRSATDRPRAGRPVPGPTTGTSGGLRFWST